MEWLRKLLDKFKVRRPIPVPVKRAQMFVDEYLWEKIDNASKNKSK